MLDFHSVMLQLLLLFTFILQAPAVSIDFPRQGDTLRGQVEVSGVMDIPSFASAELAFAFDDANASGPAESWFPIQIFSQPVTASPFAIWDTTSITDGDYKLRLRVYLQDGSYQDAVVTGLKIGNETVPTPAPTEVPFNFQPTAPPLLPTEVPATPTLIFPQPTALPTNPASLTMPAIYSTFGRGALAALVLFMLVSLLLRLRRDR